MKFARNFKDALERGEYPPEWVDSALSYKKLKKCIKRVQQELESLGLDHETLQRLWQQAAVPASTDGISTNGKTDHALCYGFMAEDNARFTPKLTIALDPRDGSPMDAWLSPETRRILRTYGKSQTRPEMKRTTSDVSATSTNSVDVISPKSSDESVTHEPIESGKTESGRGDSEIHSPVNEETEIEIETVEVPLSSDMEFFQILRKELNSLERLQETEKSHLETEIVKLGTDLEQLKKSKRKRNQEQIKYWREIFRIYTEAEVFFSLHEQDAGTRDAAHAQKQLTLFNQTLQSSQTTSNNSTTSRAGNESTIALDRFVRINADLLRLMQYQEINRKAVTKIMKKFDKQTALHAREGVLTQLNNTPFMMKDLAKATCFTISDQLLKVIPQLDDYLCPICFSISWKPIRLRCNHVFCIRCLIVMQQTNKDNCPLCRENVVLEACGENIDESMMKFLKKNFAREVKDKQRQNEIAAGVERFGPNYTGTHACHVM